MLIVWDLFFYRYYFCADNSGTHFYHSHVATQLIDGQYGSLIVREPPSSNPHLNLYDEDRLEHVIVISDLFHELSLERFPGRYRSNRGQVAQNFLVNGRGDWTVREITIPIIIIYLDHDLTSESSNFHNILTIIIYEVEDSLNSLSGSSPYYFIFSAKKKR